MRTRVLLLIAMLAAARMLYQAGEPPVSEAAEASFNLAGGTGVTGRLRHGVGVYGAVLARPAVGELLRGHARDRAALEAASRTVPELRQARTQAVLRRVAELESLALDNLEQGRPITGVKFALQAGGLIEAASDALVAERLTR